MKIFLDTADINAIKRCMQLGVIDGITTNPSNLSKEGNEPVERIKAICDVLPDSVINVEVVETDPYLVYAQAKKIAQLSSHMVVKIPCHKDYYPVIKKLVAEGIRVNITLVFSLVQALMMCKLGAQYISPFVGRLDEIGNNGLEFLLQLRSMIDQYGFKTRILAASIRSIEHFEGAILAGADVVTLPVTLFEKAIEHPLTHKGMEQFAADWKKISVSHFP